MSKTKTAKKKGKKKTAGKKGKKAVNRPPAAKADSADADEIHVRRRPVVHHLRCPIDHDRLIELGSQLGSEQQQLRQLQDERKAAMADFKSRIDRLAASVESLADTLASGKERRPIQCEEVRDFDAGRVRVVRLDTGETVEERSMSPDDRQIDMTDEEGPGHAPW